MELCMNSSTLFQSVMQVFYTLLLVSSLLSRFHTDTWALSPSLGSSESSETPYVTRTLLESSGQGPNGELVWSQSPSPQPLVPPSLPPSLPERRAPGSIYTQCVTELFLSLLSKVCEILGWGRSVFDNMLSSEDTGQRRTETLLSALYRVYFRL